MAEGVVSIRNPDRTIWQNRGIVIDGTINFDDAREKLMQEFAEAMIGASFPTLTKNDAWNLWQVAERNGYGFQVIHIAASRTDITQAA